MIHNGINKLNHNQNQSKSYKNYRLNTIEDEKENTKELFYKKEVKNLDYFKIKKKKKFKNKNLKSTVFLPILENKESALDIDNNIKILIENINYIKKEKIEVIKIENFNDIKVYFNYQNKKLFIKFKEFKILISKIKKENNFIINEKITDLNNLYYEKENWDNQLNYLKSNIDFNNKQLNELIDLKHKLEVKSKEKTKIKKELDIRKKSFFLVSNKDNKSKSIKLFDKILSDKRKSYHNFSNINTNNKVICDPFASITKNKSILKKRKKKIFKISLVDIKSNLKEVKKSNNRLTINNINLKNNTNSKRKDVDEFSIVNIKIFNFSFKNKKFIKDLNKIKKLSENNTNKIEEIEWETKEINLKINSFHKLEKKLIKNWINFIKDEIEFGYDLKNNGVLWLYNELIRLNQFNLDFYPNFLDEKYKSQIKIIVNYLIIIHKQNTKLEKIKIFQNLFVNKPINSIKHKKNNSCIPTYIKETEKIKINLNLYSFKKNFRNQREKIRHSDDSKENKYNFICDQSYKLPKISKSLKKNYYNIGKNIVNDKIIKNNISYKTNINQNFNIKFIDENNKITFDNWKNMNKKKKEILKELKNNNFALDNYIKTNKKYCLDNSVQLMKKYGKNNIIKNISSLHGIVFASFLYKFV